MEVLIKQLWSASEGQRECRIVLHNEPLPRVIQPYGVCQSTAGKIILVCIQVGGYTKGGGTAGYRNLALEKVTEVELLEKRFPIAADFDPNDPQYKEWVYHIKQENGED